MRNDIDRIVAEVEQNGIAVVANFIPADLLRRIHGEVDRLNRLERQHGVAFLESEGANQRVFNLVNKGEVFEEIVQHPDVMAVMGKLLGGDFILSGFSSNTTGPGGEEMMLHSDSGYVPPPHPEYLLSANAVWMIDDFTEENGGTRYVPGSHKLRTNPDPRENYETVPLIGKAGSIAILHGYTWHKTGNNVSRDSRRRALFAYYVRPFLRVQENHIVSVREEVWHRATPTLRHLLGGDLWVNSIGFFDGPPKAYREAAFPRRSGLGTPPKQESQGK
ncbi:MAG: phytanoyl-CoA dioxygenase family protein [Candidatus Binatus sp.]|uniref:phytanoyl-CoA dioxygenase family protein n=1 Tax=Candidatus Binatus sp. TaxID=2811406 RepID=UPI0027292A15|nr:phytanoyl-CoA dioxygenase family protein [Candidatus Binatus sp.]MDO8434741.1 phytanoyl-CoA dioxygenase family protein [Candidatus Binatus sp.]